jgi:hypothetical protein
MKNKAFNNIFRITILCLLALLCLNGCGDSKKKKYNMASLDLDIGIGFSHFDNESDYPAPSDNAYLDVYSSKIIIRDAYGEEIIETPLIYNNSSTAYPRMKLSVSGNRMYVIYCPDISLPSLQIVSTDNGGESWIQSTLNLDTVEVGTIDNFTASFWSTKNGALIISNGMVDTFIYFTDDSGKSWKRAEGAPPSQNWHDSLYTGVFLSPNIGFATYNYYSFPPAEPQIYITLDGSVTWSKLAVKVPASVMEAYALAGTPFYDGSKINIPIELYDTSSELVNTVYYVSYDFGESWEFFADDGGELELIRNAEREKWFEINRPEVLADRKYFVSDFSLYSSFELEENVRIDAYKLVAAYDIDDWSGLKLTKEMYFDSEANLYYKDSSGFPILLFVYEGDVFDHTYSLMASTTEYQYENEGETHVAKRLYEEYLEHKAIKALYNEAAEAYSWFTGYGSPEHSSEGGSVEYEGEAYESVSFEALVGTEITNLDMLSDYLSTLFSKEIVEKLMATTVSASGKKLPLYIEGENGLYRFSGYDALYSYDAITPKLTVSNLETTKATLTLSVNTVFFSQVVEFTHDCDVFLDTDGEWKFESFILAVEKAWKILDGTDNDNTDESEGSIDDIGDWDELEYTGSGSEQIRDFLEAFIYGDTETLVSLGEASSASVFDEYAKLDITSYSINKVFSSGQSRIVFEYTIGTPTQNASVRTESGTHSLYVNAGKNGIYMSDVEGEALSDAGKFLSDYFSSTLEYTLLDCTELSYSQRTDITEFLAKRCSEAATAERISGLASIIFGVYNFTPSEELKNEEGFYSKNSRGTRGLCFDVISESRMFDEIKLTVVLYADRSKLVGARKVEISLSENGADFKFIGSYTSETTDYKVYKINE